MSENKNELAIVSNVTPAVLDFNFDELDSELSSKLETYKKLIVTEDSLAGAKHARDELASLRVSLEKFRKDKKKEAEAPIKAFEDKCKKLKSKVEETEAPLNEAINVFDEKTREEKRKFARSLIDAAVQSHGLKDKFAARMVLKPEYANLNGTKKAVKEDVEKQAALLEAEQKAEEERINSVKLYVDTENARLKIKISPDSYVALVESGMTLADVYAQIKAQADSIYEQEQEVQDDTSKFTPDVPEAPTAEPEPVTEPAPEPAVSGSDTFVVPDFAQTQIPVPDEAPVHVEEPRFKVVFELEGGFSALAEINKYLKSCGVTMNVISQTKL